MSTNIWNILFSRDNYSGGLIIHRSLQIVVENIVFMNNSGSSAYINVSQLDISTSNNGFRVGGGLTISYRKSSTVSYAQVKNCTFKNNRADVSESNHEDAILRPIFYIPRGHGGGFLVAFENASNNVVSIENCLFEENYAQLGGGGVSVLFYRGSSEVSRFGVSSSRNNSLSIVGSSFKKNEAGLGGGAIQGLAFEESTDNHIVIENCSLVNNSARRGGGGLLIVLQVSN